MEHRRLATIYGAIACLIWSAAVTVAGIFSQRFGTLTAAGLEVCLSSSLILLWFAHQGKLPGLRHNSRRYYLVCGFSWALNLILFWLAIGAVTRQEELIVVGLVNYLWPTLTLLGTIIFLGASWSYWVVPGVALALLGSVLAKMSVSSLRPSELFTVMQDPNMLAYSYAFCCALAWAVYSNLSRKLIHPEGVTGVPIFMVVSGVLLFVAGRVLREPDLVFSPYLFYVLLWSLLCGSAFFLWDYAMRYGNAVMVASVSMLIPLLSTLITIVVHGSKLDLAQIVAALLVVFGAWVCSKSVKAPL